MLRTYKYRLYPRLEQDTALDFLLWQSRTVYNAALEQRIKTYKDTGASITYPEQWTHFRDERRSQPETLGKLNATSVQQLMRRLDKSFSAFFRRLQSGEKPGFPRFKGRHCFHSLEYRHEDGCKLRQDQQGRTIFYVQNVGEVKVKEHRPLPEDAAIKHVIVKRQLDKWYVCLMAEISDVEPVVVKRSVVGIDMGLKSLLALSDGQQPTVLCPPQIRLAFRKLTAANFPSLHVLSYNEIAPDVEITAVGVITMSYEDSQVRSTEYAGSPATSA
jgi:putative transposase